MGIFKGYGQGNPESLFLEFQYQNLRCKSKAILKDTSVNRRKNGKVLETRECMRLCSSVRL